MLQTQSFVAARIQADITFYFCSKKFFWHYWLLSDLKVEFQTFQQLLHSQRVLLSTCDQNSLFANFKRLSTPKLLTCFWFPYSYLKYWLLVLLITSLNVTSYCELTHFQATSQWLIYYVVSVFIQKEATNLFIYFRQ